MPVKHVTMATVRGVVVLVPWALLFVFTVGNSTLQGRTTDWGAVARVSMIGLLPLWLALALSMWLPGLRSIWRGWSGALTSWAVALVGFIVVAWWLGPFI